MVLRNDTGVSLRRFSLAQAKRQQRIFHAPGMSVVFARALYTFDGARADSTSYLVFEFLLTLMNKK